MTPPGWKPDRGRRVTSQSGAAAGGNITGSALGENSQVTNVERQYVLAGKPEVEWPVLVGSVPTLASAFQPRAGLRDEIDAARGHSRSAALGSGPSEEMAQAPASQTSAHVLAGGGGVGKSQLAASYARNALGDGTELVVWASAADIQQVVIVYAQAALRVQAPGADGRDLERDARLFLQWLAGTSRRWLVVLDNITDPEAIAPWWPDGRPGTGWVLGTTRLKDPRLTGGGRVPIDVDVYTHTEATTYLDTRLAHDRKTHLVDNHADALVEALGYLPLALGHAAAFMIREDASCGAYLEQFSHRAARMEEVLPRWADTERYGRQITTTLLLAMDAAVHDKHGSLAWAAIGMAALLDPAGHPCTLWDSTAATDYLTLYRPAPRPKRSFGRRGGEAPKDAVTAGEARAVLRLLHRYGLLSYDTTTEPCAVRMHALTARAVRESIPDHALPVVATAAASALLHSWPNPDKTGRDLASTLRANTAALSTYVGDRIWEWKVYSVLYHAGRSLREAGFHILAIAYWKDLVADSERLMGRDHFATLSARGDLAACYALVGYTNEAITLLERLVADEERLFGAEPANTLISRGNLATAYWRAGRADEAVRMGEQVVADSERLLGPEAPETLSARVNLAAFYREAERADEAIVLTQRVLDDNKRLLGPEAPGTLSARASLAVCYRYGGRADEAVRMGKQVVADSERLLGPEAPETLYARANLAASYGAAGRTDEAIRIGEQVVADSERLLGTDHHDTVAARIDLASSYGEAGRVREAIALLERIVATCRHLLGSDAPKTVALNRELERWRRFENSRQRPSST
ncbi:tetratricopeptide repeat protein [Streptomyces melanosporofaciens]|uniref:Tetratricopeptide (TPR) repeat n=1 Tax=Streptomyces melanosporofaciens TaxID=67327 RepID=A0A1H4KN83_STRMJ|nr:tetratricopeptide repeat protein [Streptomyces melanosporofaciens]SEB59937.1 Tetratricopeptide (TPR) repeat [Streptomyces melanosporofaciens]